MFERVVATLLHRYLGKYIQDLDTENLNVGIFGGQVQLTDLKIKPDALYELDLPIEVKVGAIGRINIKIPWGGFSKESVVIEMEEVHIIAAPITDREYDPEKEKRLTRASKRRKLEILEKGNILGNDAPESPSFMENLMTTIMNNLQVFIHNIHIRYEDSVMSESSFAAGICLQGLSIETTNSKWKPMTTTVQSLPSVYQMIKLESLSVYCNPVCTELVGKDPEQDSAAPYTWRNDMKRGLETFSVRGEEFEFILKPITAKMKLIVNKSNEARVPKLLVDFVLQDAATQLSRLQYLSLIELFDSFKRININRRFRQFHPGKKLPGNAPLWWKYAYNGVLEQRVRPYTWERIKNHRNNIRQYIVLYKQILLKPTNTELKLDLQKCEDLLTITDIIIAREYSKSQLLKEVPERVNIIEKQGSWWARSSKTYKELDVVSGKGRGIWAQLSPCEKNQLFDAIGYCQEYIVFDKPKQYIEHKINFTLANCSLSLLKRGHEVLVLTLAQFLASLETRPSARAFKFSARVESFVIEGANVDHDLIPVITADNIYTGNPASNFLSLDFEKNPLNSEADYGLTINLEPIEVAYHEHAISELISFFQTANTSLPKAFGFLTEIASEKIKTLAEKSIKRYKAIDLNLDFKLPYLVIPELGTLQKGGNLAIVDFGHVKVSTELQPSNINLEDATHMELEERLYDRFNIEFTEFQILFCDAGDIWRDAKKLNDTEFHLLPKLSFQFSFSNSVRPEYKTLPRYKLNVGLSSLKINISDRKIGSVMDFLDNLPLPSVNTVHVSESSNIVNIANSDEFEKDEYEGELTHGEMLDLKIILIETVINAINRPGLSSLQKDDTKVLSLQDHKNFISTDQSDEEIELWARTVDLPGFDDNVSPNNAITMLLRFIVGEIVVQLCRSCNRIDKPYLMLRITNICCDAAIMEYGPAIQATLGSIQLVDKLHTAPSGQYLELIATEPGVDLASLLYRKVRADCPDFKSHFHNVEQSLVLDFSAASVVLHREAFVTLNKYVQYLLQKIQNREIMLVHKLMKRIPVCHIKEIVSQKSDPPIPPGATKFSYSTRVHEFKLKFCDTDIEFLELKVNGLESDCLFKANERMVLQFYLSSISIEDLSGMTLYPKILVVDDEKVIQFKYVRHNPRFYKNVEIENKRDDVKSDGSLKVQIGRMQLVVLSKLLIDLQHFMEPFVKPNMVHLLISKIEREFREKFDFLKSCGTKIHLALDIHTPSFLFPQKMTSPNLILVCPGDLKVENFFKEKLSEGTATPIIDNILIILDNINLSRAIMTLAGSLEVQEPVIEPMSIKLDVKRSVNYTDTKTITMFARSMSQSYSQSTTPLMLYQIDGVVDNIRINLGQKDLMTILSVWNDNFKNGNFITELCNNWTPTSPSEIITPVPPSEDQSVRKLQAFFYQNEQIKKETTIRFTFEGLQIYLFSDCDEVLSSPMRDMNQGLCKLETGEASLSVDIFSDKSLEMKISLLSAVVEDIRKEIETSNRKILHVYSGSPFMEENVFISVSLPPIIDATYKQTQTGDKCIDVLVECIRLSLSISFILDFTRFLLDSLPPDKYTEGGLINHGYVGDSAVQNKPTVEIVRPPSSVDSTSGYFSSRASCNEEQTGISISLQIKKPEVIIYSSGGYSLLLKTEIIVDFSRHVGQESLVFSLAGLRLLSKYQNPHNEQPPYLVLQPCDIEFARTIKVNDGGLKITTNVSFIDIHITPSVVHSISLILEEFNLGMAPGEQDPNNTLFGYVDIEDLWSPKKIVPYQFSHRTDNFGYGRDSGRVSEIFTATIPKVRIVFELEDCAKRAPMILVKAFAEAVVSNWSTNLQMKGGLQVQASYFNSQIGTWEPLIEPSVEDEGIYRPIEIQIKIFRAKAYLIQPRHHVSDTTESTVNSICKLAKDKSIQKVVNSEESETSEDEQEETGSMIFIRKRSHREHKAKHESVSLISYPEDSDSENEEGVMEKLANAINHLFTGDSSDGEVSDSNDSSGAEPSPDTDDVSEAESNASISNTKDSRPILIKKRSDSIDSGLETEGIDKIATYVVIETKDQIDLTVTPQSLHVIQSLYSSFTNIAQLPMENSLTLINDLTPNSTVTLLSKAEVGPAKVLMTATYERSDSLPSSPASSTAPTDFFSPVGSDVDGDYFEDNFSTKKPEQSSTADMYSPYLKFPIEPVSCLYKKVTDHRVRFQIPGFDEIKLLCPQRTCHKLHLLQPIKQNTRYYIVLSVKCHDWGQKITLRSPLQVRNETSYAIALYYKKSILESLGYDLIGESTNPFEDTYRIAIIEPDETFNVPLTIAHHCKLHLMPTHVDNYSMSESALWWQDLAADLNSPKDILCPPKEEKDTTVFSTRVLCEEGVKTQRQSRLIPNYLLRIIPSLSFQNRLPYAIEIKIPSSGYEVRIESGENANVYCLNLSKSHKIIVNVPTYLGILWTGSFNLSPEVEEKIIGMATEQDTEGGNKQLGLSMKVERSETCEVILHAPYWIINKTGLPLQIRASLTDVVYEAQGEEPLLFCYRKQRKPCVRLRAYHSSWSSAFSLDAFTTSGLVICKDRERKRRYRILLKVDLSEVCPQMTKMITLLPNFIISNETKKPLRYMEENEKADLWIDLAPSQATAFWPETDRMYMLVKFRDSKVVSQHFPVASNHSTVLRMDRGGALCVKVTGGGDRPFSVVFHNYTTGEAPVRVDNLCEDLFLKVHQQQLGQVALLSPYQSMLYTWDDPCKERSLLWNVYNKKSKDYLAEIWKDGYGQEKVSFHMVKKQQSTPQMPTVTAKLSASLKRFSTVPSQTVGSSSSEDSESDELQKPQLTKKTRKDKVVVYWVSYLEGPQRVLLFTQDERVAYKTRLKIDSEKSYLELFISLKGFGLSLANQKNGILREVAYITLRDSAPIWEVNVASRWKPLTLELAAWIEDRWKQDSKKAQMKELVHVDFEKMHMTKPFYGELRRRYIPAAWIQYRKSLNYMYIQAKIYRLQIENQMHNAVFPIVLYPKPLPRNLQRKSGERPSFEMAILKRQQNAQSDDVYKSIKIHMREFMLQLDQNFVFNMFEICSPWISEVKPSVRIRSDITALYQPLSHWCKISNEPKLIIEQLLISPISVQVNFIINGRIPNRVYGKSFEHDVTYFIFDTLSSSHLEMKGLNLRTTAYERKGLIDTRQNQLNEIWSHFSSQLFPQFHVLVFGLDILGNPYSVVTDFHDGFGNLCETTFFESPEEYCDSLSTGAQTLIGHIRGPVSTSTLITSGLTDSSVLMQFDDDYKKKRRLCCLQQSGDLPLGIVCNSRTFEVSIALGMAGLMIKHQTGLQQNDGLELFFRTIGKGLMGLLTKPTGGIIDCQAMASDGIKRASEICEEFVMRTRQPRHMDQYLGVKPYSPYEAAGKQLLTMINKGHYADTDIYWTHAPLTSDGRTFLLVTIHHVFLIEKCRLWGTWEVEWGVRVDDIMSVPTIENSALVFKVRQDDTYAYLTGDERTVPCRDKPMLQWLQKKIEAVMIINMEDKPCPVTAEP